MAARVELKISFDTISEYNEFCAGNGIQVETPIGKTDAMDAEPTLVVYDPVADGSVEAEPDPAPAAPASGKKRGRPAKAAAPAAEETPPAEPEPPVEAPSEPPVEAQAATLDDAMDAGERLVEACGNKLTEAQAILKSMGFSRVSAMGTPEQFAEFIRRCDEAVAAKGAGTGSIL